MWKKRVDVTIASSTKLDIIKKAQALLKKGEEPDVIKEQLNLDNVINVMTNSGAFEEGSDALPKGMKYDVGVSDFFKEGEYYFVTNVEKVIPETVKSLEECKGKIVNDYQQYLEQRWVDDLKQEFTVKINKDVFERLKKQLQY
jgi:peptidyl-prolyl cis-trans isomerase SurA